MIFPVNQIHESGMINLLTNLIRKVIIFDPAWGGPQDGTKNARNEAGPEMINLLTNLIRKVIIFDLAWGGPQDGTKNARNGTLNP